MKRNYLLSIGLLGVSAVLSAGVAGWMWYSHAPTQEFRVVALGSTKSNDHVKLTGGNLDVVAPRPGLFFGTVRRPGEKEQFTYVIHFRYGLSAGVATHPVVRSRCTSEGRVAETRNSLELNGKRIEAVYRLTMDETLSAVEQESLTIGGDPVDVSLGRVFLIDLSDENPEYSQRRIGLPIIDSLETTEDVEQLASKLTTILQGNPRSQINNLLRGAFW